MKNFLKKTVYFCMMALFVVMLSGCDGKINPAVLAEYARTVDPETLREYVDILEYVADGIESGEIEMIEFEDVDLGDFDGQGFLVTMDDLDDEDDMEDMDGILEDDEDAIEDIDEDALEDDEDAELEDDDKDEIIEIEIEVENDTETDKDADIDEDAEAEEPEESTEVDEKVNKVIEISEQFSLSDTIVYSKDKSVDVEYNVPSIEDDTKDAKAINEEIYDFCSDSIETAQDLLKGKAKDKTQEPKFATINYDIYENNGIVSIIVCGTSADEENTEYKVFNYDTNEGKRIDNDSMIESFGIEADDFEEYVKKTLGAQVFLYVDDEIELIKSLYSEDSQEIAIILGTINAFYQYTLSNIDVADDVLVYIDEDGDPAIIGKVFVPTSDTAIPFETKLAIDEKPEIFDEYVKYANKYRYPELEMNSMLLDEGMKYVLEIPEEYKVKDFAYDEVSVGFDDEDSSVFVVEYVKDKETFRYTGSVEVAGFSENGINFHYELTSLNGKNLGKKSLKGNFDVMLVAAFNDEGDILSQAARIAVTDGYDFIGTDGEALLFDLVK